MIARRLGLAARSLTMALAMASLAACTTERNVATITEIRTCPQVAVVRSGYPCDFDGTCVVTGISEPPPPTCCTRYATCADSKMQAEDTCNSPCQRCETDAECAYGVDVCASQGCTPCPEASTCAACPRSEIPVVRNGCVLCECAPP